MKQFLSHTNISYIKICSAALGFISINNYYDQEQRKYKISEFNIINQIFNSNIAQAYIREEDRSRLYKINTNVYVFGEGFQVDPTQDYSNFTPKKIQQFKGKDKPNIVDMAFGWYHEAYIDSKGKLYVCQKAKLSSIEVEGVRDGDRKDLIEVSNMPKGTKVRQVAFTQSRMFVLSESGDVFLYKINEYFPKKDEIGLIQNKNSAQIKGELMVNEVPVKIKNIDQIKQIACGLDHVLFLNKKGEVFAMGDDSFGQCGVGQNDRQGTAPFFESRHRKPVKVQFPLNKDGKDLQIKKIVCGFRHSLAITTNGQIYGWGYNNQQQLSNSQEYADEQNPQHAIFSPKRLMGPLEDLFVVDAAAGEEMSIIVAQGKKAGIIFEQTYGCGNNLKGQLGINRNSHLQDLTLIPDISDLFDEGEQALFVNNISCGRRHCVASFDYGAFMFWGDNQVGQLGNRKRSFIESPYPSKKFEYRHNVENVVLGIDSSGVIVEDTGIVKKKNTKKNKKILKLDQVVTSEDDLKLKTEALLIKQSDHEKDSRGRRSLIERIKANLFEKVYGDVSKNDDKNNDGKQRELDRLIEEEKQQQIKVQDNQK